MRVKEKIKLAIKHTIRYGYFFYADSTEMLDKAQKLLRPLPEGCEFVKLTQENKDFYKCTLEDVDKMLQVNGDVWAVVNNENEVIAYHFGTYRGEKSLFFNVKNCDFEHIEIKVDEKFRRKGIALNLLYHMIKNLHYEEVNHKRLGTFIKPNNIKSIKLHELIGFKKARMVVFIHFRSKKNGHYSFINIPRWNL